MRIRVAAGNYDKGTKMTAFGIRILELFESGIMVEYWRGLVTVLGRGVHERVAF
jgi:hypothetical protein